MPIKDTSDGGLRFVPRQFQWQDLVNLPTISAGHTGDLKIDTGTSRVWVSRMTIADGETQPVQVEKLIAGRWVDVTQSPDGRSSYNDVPLDGEYEGHTVYCLTRSFRERSV